MTNEDWMKLAIQEANAAEKIDEVPVGAVLVLGDKILAKGKNERETKQDCLSHAELEVLKNYQKKSNSWRLPEGASLYVTVEPCLMCTGALISARLSHLYFGCADTKNAGYSRIKELIEQGVFDHRFKSVLGGVMQSECSLQLSRYFKNKRK